MARHFFRLGLILLAVAVSAVVLLSRFWSHQVALATAPAPPNLVPATLNGKPAYVLYVTRSEDRVLVRCYPGFAPTIAVRPMGGNPGMQEGVLACVSSPQG